jgi:hypothetical protein
MRAMSERKGNIFRFRRLKWGAPKRLDGLGAIERARPSAPEPRGIGGSGIGIVVAAIAAALAVGMGLLGWF